MRNTGKKSEDVFEDFWLSRGKRSYAYRFLDAGDLMRIVRAVTGKSADIGSKMPPVPGDYLVFDTEYGPHLAEVKSTVNKTSFSLLGIRSNQWSSAKETVSAGGSYYFYIHSLHLKNWYRVPAQVLLDLDSKSIKWKDLEEYIWLNITK